MFLFSQKSWGGFATIVKRKQILKPTANTNRILYLNRIGSPLIRIGEDDTFRKVYKRNMFGTKKDIADPASGGAMT